MISRVLVATGICLGLACAGVGWCQESPAATPTAEINASQAVTNPNAPSAPATAAKDEAQELANQVNNPAAPVTYIQFRNILVPSVPDTKGAVNALQMQPVLAIGPFGVLPWVQLMKITWPMLMSTPGIPPPVGCIACGTGTSGVTGLGDLQLFDLVTIKQSWGRWGFGPALVFPTATSPLLGAGKWQAGPSAALIYTGIKNLTVGAIVQNPISYAGSGERSAVNQMTISPTFTFNLQKGWFVGLTDYNWSFNWEKGGAPTIPVGMQFGKIVKIGKQPISLSMEAGGAAARPAGTPNPGWILGFELTPIFNFHLGPGEKIQVRGKPSS